MAKETGRTTKKNKVKDDKILAKNPLLKTLNLDQGRAIDQMVEFIIKSKDQFFLLKGGAGTGKTYTVGALIAYLQEKKEKLWIAASAPTNKAVKVLENSTQKWDIHNIDYGTIYQFLGLKMDYDNDGKKVLVEGKQSKIGKYDLVIIDEASMISSNLWDLLNELTQRYPDTKFLLMGDNAQLNPVNEPLSPIFSQVQNVAELTQIMRTSEINPVMDIIESARAKVFDPNAKLLMESRFTDDKMSGVWILNRSKWLAQIVRAFQSPQYKDNPDFCRAIAWRNKTVDFLNNYIRTAIHSDSSIPYLPGERLSATDTIFDPIDCDDIIISNSQEVEVINAFPESFEEYNIWRLDVIDEKGIKYHLKVIDKSSKTQFQNNLKLLAKEANIKATKKEPKPWKEYHKYKHRFAELNYAYAMTSHKSQGSSFSNVFVHQADLFLNRNLPELYRSLYVSYSRCCDRLIINV
jgi:exodeoxyribonuclease-5